jgi:hypothetical protein
MRNDARHNHWLGRLIAHGAALEVTLLVAVSTFAGCDYIKSIGNSDGDAGIPTTRTGILIVNDAHNKWSLASGNELFQLHGNRSELTKYERQRVTINGGVYGPERLNVLSIKPDKLDDREIRAIVKELSLHRWIGPVNRTIPTNWEFNFTAPMLQLLQAGPASQNLLLQYLGDPKVVDRELEDQIIILLGGVGDEKAVEPIIRAMSTEGRSTDARRTNLVANLALTNITQSEVIWGHGGGIPSDSSPDDAKARWLAWWAQNRASFKVSSEPENRNYSNYPNYGIYQQA